MLPFYYILLITRCRKLPKALKNWKAYKDLKKKIDDFNESCPLLELMANKAMKARHWKKLSAVTKHEFDVDSESFFLKNIMEAPLLENKEDIEVKLFLVFLPLCRDSRCLVISFILFERNEFCS